MNRVGKPLEVTTELLEQAARTPAVLAALRAKADRMLPNAQRVAAGAGAVEFGRALRVEEGVRPGSKAKGGLRRPYARVTADVTEEMRTADAGSKLTRTQILRRSARA